jgi:hypothetical protein
MDCFTELSSLRERCCARRGGAEPVIGRAFARPVGADRVVRNDVFKDLK